jgi:hypothetical protein
MSIRTKRGNANQPKQKTNTPKQNDKVLFEQDNKATSE